MLQPHTDCKHLFVFICRLLVRFISVSSIIEVQMKLGLLLKESIALTFSFLKANKLRSALSVLGITIGIFCIVSIITATHSLEQNLRANLDKMGDNIVYVQKMPWSFGARTPWWAYQSRPQTSVKEYERVKLECDKNIIKSIAFFYEFGNNTLTSPIEELTDIRATAIKGDFFEINQWELADGRTFSNFEIEKGGNSCIIGYNIGKSLFAGKNPVGRKIKLNGQKITIIGVLDYQGNNMGGSQYDDIVVLSSVYASKFAKPKSNNNISTSIALKGYKETDIKYLEFEVRRIMRSIRRLKPKISDNFAVNKLTTISNLMDNTFKQLDIVAWIIGGFSLLVGGFGIANIMFVSVKERTGIIGLQKALGAKQKFILSQFLFESVMLCILGAMIGILIVVLGSFFVSSYTSFQVYFSTKIFIIGVSISIVIGLVAGMAPALLAARMDPVVALRK